MLALERRTRSIDCHAAPFGAEQNTGASTAGRKSAGRPNYGRQTGHCHAFQPRARPPLSFPASYNCTQPLVFSGKAAEERRAEAKDGCSAWSPRRDGGSGAAGGSGGAGASGAARGRGAAGAASWRWRLSSAPFLSPLFWLIQHVHASRLFACRMLAAGSRHSISSSSQCFVIMCMHDGS